MLISLLIADFADYLLGERDGSPATVTACKATLKCLVAFFESKGWHSHFEQATTSRPRKFGASLKQSGTISGVLRCVQRRWSGLLRGNEESSRTIPWLNIQAWLL